MHKRFANGSVSKEMRYSIRFLWYTSDFSTQLCLCIAYFLLYSERGCRFEHTGWVSTFLNLFTNKS